MFTTTEPIIPTGTQNYPATKATGELTIYNGSILTQRFPAGLILTTTSGVEVVADASVIVPAGNPPSYGIATVEAHAVVGGTQGNIPPYAIDEVDGTSLYIRNVTPFHEGENAYSVKVVTVQDITRAVDAGEAILAAKAARRQAILADACKETTRVKNRVVGLTWACQFVSYSVPPYMKVTAARLVGKNLLVDVVFVPRPRIVQFK